MQYLITITTLRLPDLLVCIVNGQWSHYPRRHSTCTSHHWPHQLWGTGARAPPGPPELAYVSGGYRGWPGPWPP